MFFLNKKTGEYFVRNEINPISKKIVIEDDEVAILNMGADRSMIMITQLPSGKSWVGFIDVVVPKTRMLQENTGAFALLTGVLEGTTGAPGVITLSPHTDGKLYVENRMGSKKRFLIVVISRTNKS